MGFVSEARKLNRETRRIVVGLIESAVEGWKGVQVESIKDHIIVRYQDIRVAISVKGNQTIVHGILYNYDDTM